MSSPCLLRVTPWLIFCLLLATPLSAADRPNILFIFGDDIGIDGFNCYGSDRGRRLTPNIDQLAKSGTRFERCYAMPVCGPLCLAIMTGRYGFRTGGLTNETAQFAKYQDEPALAKILQQAGYKTGMAGKWRQMSNSPGDWGFDEYITDPTAGGYYWKNTYTKNGQPVTLDHEIYYPDVCNDFAIEFMRAHKDEPFYFYLSQHSIHGPITHTPDSQPGEMPHQWYDDNVAYLDKTVGKMIAALDELGLREKTVVIFATDNGTSRIGYLPEHDPDKISGKIGGRSVNGLKGTVLEGGSRVPLIANWPGKTPEGKVLSDLIDFTDLLPTFADLAGAPLPKEVKFDGRSFAPQIRGEAGEPREWIFVQLRVKWYARNNDFKLNEAGELFSMKDAPFVEQLIPADSTDAEAVAARKKLQDVLTELNPAAGKTAPAKTEADRAQQRRNRRNRAAAEEGATPENPQ